jgi:acetyltransferase-like isoleucine patch superfamily enzyme
VSRYLDHDWFPESLPDNVKLGERTWLYSTYAFRHYQSRRLVGLRTGHDTGLYNGTFFDLGPHGEVSIGHYCALVGAIICSNGRVEIGDYAFIAHEVVIADTFAAVPYFLDPAGPATAPPLGPAGNAQILIGENVWIGARAILLSGAVIGAGAIVGAAAVIDFEVPPYAVVAGNPARIVKSIRR